MGVMPRPSLRRAATAVVIALLGIGASWLASPVELGRHALPNSVLMPLGLQMLAFGLAMVLVMIWRPQGLVSGREPSVRLHPEAR